jgi:hypothetical protein
MIQLHHPYPRYGLAATLVHHGLEEPPEDLARLAELAAETLQHGLHHVRIHTEDDPQKEGTQVLRYRYLRENQLKTSGQSSKNYYYLAPHVATDDTGTNALIKEARNFRDGLRQESNLNKYIDLKRSFSPFTTKINQGTLSLSNPKTSYLTAVLTAIATLTPHKPAAQIDFKNQVIIPGLDLKDMVSFVALFSEMQRTETKDLMLAHLSEGSKYFRPALHRGNYPYAPRSPDFGPVGLLGAIGRWARRAGQVEWAKKVLEAMAERPLYLVSYDWKLMRQVHLSHHVVRLALRYDLPEVLDGLFRSRLYKEDKVKRNLFRMMAGRFLQLYNHAAFRDFLSFRAHYRPTFKPILEDYFMTVLPEDIVQSARAYGAYLNRVAYFEGKAEADKGETGRSVYEAKTRVLAQMESSAMSAKRTSALFAQLNVTAGRFSNRDVPKEAERFIEAAMTGEVDLTTAKELILAFMRLETRADSPASATSESPTVDEEDDPYLEDA